MKHLLDGRCPNCGSRDLYRVKRGEYFPRVLGTRVMACRHCYTVFVRLFGVVSRVAEWGKRPFVERR